VGELLGEAVDVLRRDGLERDGCLSLFHGVDCTSIPPIFEHPPAGLDFAVIDRV
jgi:hypothetical protein